MILFATTNAEPSMAPEGGLSALFRNESDRCFLSHREGVSRQDRSFHLSGCPRKHHCRAEAGRKNPRGVGARCARKSDDSAAEALLGTVLTMAGHKGYALALMVEVFSGVLSGSAFGSSIGSMYKNMDRKQDVGHFFCLLDIDAFEDVRRFYEPHRSMIDEIKASKLRPGVREILIPGERSFAKAQENRMRGIVIGDETLKELKAPLRGVQDPLFSL